MLFSCLFSLKKEGGTSFFLQAKAADWGRCYFSFFHHLSCLFNPE
jgi:hypothetical protein